MTGRCTYMRIAFCDDEQNIGIVLEEYLREWFDQNELEQPEYSYYPSGEKLLEEDKNIDIAFLDVRMDGISGIEVGRNLKNKNQDVIIFMETSYLEYLDDAMRFHVFRYLTKPIEKDRLFRNMDDAMNQYRNIQNSHRKVQVKSQDEVYMVSASAIVYIEARDHRTYVHTRERQYITWDPLEKWISQLDSESFFLTHRSFLVNMEYVTNFSKNRVYLCDGKYQAYLTAKKYKEFSEAYGKLLNNVW